MGIKVDPDQQMASRIAWAYYGEELTQAQIAARLGITRVRVNRILQSCRQSGLVQVSINSELAGCVELEWKLERTFGLHKAVVVPTPARNHKLYEAIGHATGGYISSTLRKNQSLGLGWGRTLRASCDSILQEAASNLSIISLFGGLPRSVDTNPYEIASLYAHSLQASECFYIPAPMYVATPETRRTLMSQPMFEALYKRAASVDLACIGSGDLTHKATNVVLEALTPQEHASLLDAGAVAEIFGYFINSRGEPVDHPINNCVMGPGLESMQNIPMTILAAGGPQKTNSLRAVLTGQYVHVLITDEATARTIITASQ